jgi:ankyrin repeat protein
MLLEQDVRQCINELNKTFDYDKKTLIHIATIANNLEGVRLLFKHGCSLNTLNIYNQSPLMLAILNNNEKMVNLINELNNKFNGDEYNKLEMKFKQTSKDYKLLYTTRQEEKKDYDKIFVELRSTKRSRDYLRKENIKLIDENNILKERNNKLRKMLEK